jgi:hypothetical protein
MVFSIQNGIAIKQQLKCICIVAVFDLQYFSLNAMLNQLWLSWSDMLCVWNQYEHEFHIEKHVKTDIRMPIFDHENMMLENGCSYQLITTARLHLPFIWYIAYSPLMLLEDTVKITSSSQLLLFILSSIDRAACLHNHYYTIKPDSLGSTHIILHHVFIQFQIELHSQLVS